MQSKLNAIADSPNQKLLTVSRDELLTDGSDAGFRRMIHTLMAISNNIEALRSGYGSLIGITGAQHEILLLISRINNGNGVTVGEVATLIGHTSAFVATETAKLSEAGVIEKIPSAVDRRQVILHITDMGLERLSCLAPHQRKVNDVLFESLSREKLMEFARLIEEILPCSEKASDLISMIVKDVARSKLKALPGEGREASGKATAARKA
jgi:DNA-binding MarR family transcriptional regulator